MPEDLSLIAAPVPRWSTSRLNARARSWAGDRVNLVLCVVFLVAGAFYVWTAGTSIPLTLDGGGLDRYNLLATAFLHFKLSVGNAPAGLLHLSQPYNPAQNATIVDGGINDATNLHDDILYGGHLYFLWGPAPALILLVPLHLFGLEPSSSVTVAVFAIAGLGFALGTLRVVLRQIGNETLWMCALAGSALALCSAVPFILRAPSVTEDTIAGGFCFAMAGIWLATSAVASRRASLPRVALMSLCFGLAAGSRPPLGLAALALVPVYMSLRFTHSHRRLLIALIAPVGVCGLLLLAYNQARFGNPLEFGNHYQLSGYDQLKTRYGDPAYVPPGAWFYTLSPPRPAALFPFLELGPPPTSYPGTLPTEYLGAEITGGLLPMTPIICFLLALPWIWRRRPAWLGSLALPLLILAGTGLLCMLLLSYELPAVTERYEVDFSTLLLLGALAAWLALSHRARAGSRRLVRVGGGLLAAWGCLTGLAISFVGYGNYLASKHPGTWTTLENIGSPLSTAIASGAGRPVLAEVRTRRVKRFSSVNYTDLGTDVKSFWLYAQDRANLAIVSPDDRIAALEAEMTPVIRTIGRGNVQIGGGPRDLVVKDSGHATATYYVPPSGARFRIPVQLSRGLNRLELLPLASTMTLPNRRYPTTISVLLVSGISLASRY